LLALVWLAERFVCVCLHAPINAGQINKIINESIIKINSTQPTWRSGIPLNSISSAPPLHSEVSNHVLDCC
jgi:hypothetical protein